MTEDRDPLKCSVCEEDYGIGKHCPRILSCSHTFCSVCIGKLITGNCPVCRKKISARSDEDVAVNRALLDVVDMLTKTSNFSANLGQRRESFFKVWQKTFSKDLKEGSIAFCTKEKALTDEAMKKKQELEARFQGGIDKIKDKLMPALREISNHFEVRVKKIAEDYQFLETKYEALSKEKEELQKIDSNVKASKSFASVDSYVSLTEEIEKRLETFKEEMKDFTINDELEHTNMLKELEDAERKLTVVEDILGHENKEENTRRASCKIVPVVYPESEDEGEEIGW